MLPGSAAREGYVSVFQLADAWPLTEGRFAEECSRILALSSAHARCLPSATVVDRYGVPLRMSTAKLCNTSTHSCQCLLSPGRLEYHTRPVC